MYAKCDSYFHRANLTGAHIPSNQWPEIPHIAHRPFGGDSIARFNTSRDLDEGAGVVLRDGRIYEVSTRLLSLQCAGRLLPNAQKHKVVGTPIFYIKRIGVTAGALTGQIYVFGVWEMILRA